MQHGQHHQGPDQVELLLDGQRPGVGEGGHRPGGHEVVAAGGDLPPVGEVEQGRQGAHPEVGVEAGRLGEPHHEGHGHQHDEQRRQQPAGPAQPEGRQLDAAPLAVLAEQQAGDQVAGQHVEDVQAEEAALQPPHAEVVAHDDEQGHGPQAVEGGDPLLAGGRGRAVSGAWSSVDRLTIIVSAPPVPAQRRWGGSGAAATPRPPWSCGCRRCSRTVTPSTTDW